MNSTFIDSNTTPAWSK